MPALFQWLHTVSFFHAAFEALAVNELRYLQLHEEKYGVKITFPRESSADGEGKTREVLKADEVLVKGGRKGVAGAKQELMEVSRYCNYITVHLPVIPGSRIREGDEQHHQVHSPCSVGRAHPRQGWFYDQRHQGHLRRADRC